MRTDRVGMMVHSGRNAARVLALYQQHNDLGLTLCAFSLRDVDWSRQTVPVLFFNRREVMIRRTIELPRVVYNRCYGAGLRTVERITRANGRSSCFNHQNQLDKWRVHQALTCSAVGDYLPETRLFGLSELDLLLRTHGTVFVKPRRGRQGRRVCRLRAEQAGEVNVSEHSLTPLLICRDQDALRDWASELPRDQYLMQQGISLLQTNGRFFDLRVLVQKDITGAWQVTNTVARIAWPGYFNTSVTESVIEAAEVLPPQITSGNRSTMDELSRVGISAAAVLEQQLGALGEISVDFGLDRAGRPWIIEINGNPQKGIYRKVPGLAQPSLVYRRPLEYAHFLLNQGS